MKGYFIKIVSNTAKFLVIIGSAILLNACADCVDCVHGSKDKNGSECECICENGWTGKKCDVPEGSSFFEATIAYPGPLAFQSTDVELKQKSDPNGPDTLVINAETVYDEWFHIRLAVNDLGSVNHKTFPVTPQGLLNQVWITHQNKTITSEVFTPKTLTTQSGFLTIDSLNTSNGYLDATFEARLSTTGGDTCNVTKGVIKHR